MVRKVEEAIARISHTRLPTVVNGARSGEGVIQFAGAGRELEPIVHVFPFQCSRFFSTGRICTSGVSSCDLSTASWAGGGGITDPSALVSGTRAGVSWGSAAGSGAPSVFSSFFSTSAFSPSAAFLSSSRYASAMG